jgi:hypothetical protein
VVESRPGVQPPQPFTLVIFGATGDLAKLETFPALVGLAEISFQEKKSLGLSTDSFASRIVETHRIARLTRADLQVGDIVYEVNGVSECAVARTITDYIQVRHRPGQVLTLQIIRGDERSGLAQGSRQNDDFASMFEAVTRRYRRLQEEKKPMPGLILIDGGLGQLHAAAQALEALQIINQPMASIAKKEEILYVLGLEDEPIILERHSPVLHLIQQIRNETHRFAVSFHRQRRGARQTKTALLDIPGIGPVTAQRLLQRFGSVANLQRASQEELSRMVSKKSAEKIRQYFAERSKGELTVISNNGG